MSPPPASEHTAVRTGFPLGRWAEPALAGGLIAACFPPLSLVPVAFVALVPLAVAVDREDESRRGARTGFVCGVVAWAILLSWMPGSLWPATRLAPGLYVLAVLVLAGYVAVFAWALRRLRTDARWPLWLAVPVAWTAAEWLRGHTGPFAFPWLELGTSLASVPVLAAPAEVVGGRGLTFWLAASSGLVATALRKPASRGRLAVSWLLVVTVPVAWGVVRNRTMVPSPVARVALFQPNVPIGLAGRSDAADSVLARLDRLASRLPPDDLDLAVWPEATFRTDPRHDPGLAERIAEVVDHIGAPVLFGAHVTEQETDGTPVTSNALLLWRPGIGDTGYTYRKRRLVPGVEAVPFLARGFGSVRGFGAGSGPVALPPAPVPPIVPLICYESIFSADARRTARAGALLLVNATNDVWFGRRPAGTASRGMRQHAQHLVIRSVELGMGAARAANTGLTLFVHPSGRLGSVAPAFEAAVRVDTVWSVPRAGLYERTGDVAGAGSALATVLFVGIGWARRRRTMRRHGA